MKNISLILLTLIALIGMSCGGDGGGSQTASLTKASSSTSGEGTVISGQIANAANLQVFLDRIQFSNSNEMITKSDIDTDGNFSMTSDKPLDQGIYRLRIGAVKMMLILDGSEKNVSINGDLTNIAKGEVSIEGAKYASEFINMVRDFQSKKISLDQVSNYANTTDNALAAALTARSFLDKDEKFLQSNQVISTKLSGAMPGSKYASEFNTWISNLAKQIAANKAKARIAVGQPAPDIKLENPTGKPYALSDLKGKVVLIDFWASWCGPCRKANPHVVSLYDKYNKQGFEVFSVSLDGINPRSLGSIKTEEQKQQRLDSAKKRWVQAIEKDNLKWPYHVSDLGHWGSAPAGVYGVRGIPRTFLIDKNGLIAAINPRGPQLEQEIKKQL